MNTVGGPTPKPNPTSESPFWFFVSKYTTIATSNVMYLMYFTKAGVCREALSAHFL